MRLRVGLQLLLDHGQLGVLYGGGSPSDGRADGNSRNGPGRSDAGPDAVEPSRSNARCPGRLTKAPPPELQLAGLLDSWGCRVCVTMLVRRLPWVVSSGLSRNSLNAIGRGNPAKANGRAGPGLGLAGGGELALPCQNIWVRRWCALGGRSTEYGLLSNKARTYKPVSMLLVRL